MKVTQLQIRNYMGIKAVDITPDDYVVRIEGRNGAGKSDTIDAVWTAIGGAARHPKEPIRHGQKEGSISIILGDLFVTKRFRGDKAYLDVRNADGSKIKEPPQTLLSKLYNDVSRDPQEFIDMPAKRRREYLLELTGKKADLDRLDDERKALYVERNKGIITAIGNRAEQFWRDYVLTNTPPPDAEPGNIDTFKRIVRVPGSYADIESDIIATWEQARASRSAAQKVEAAAFADVLLHLGDAEGVQLDDGRELTYFQQSRTSVDAAKLRAEYPAVFEAVQKQSTYRVARIRKAR